MNVALMKNWNSVVRPEDEVIHGGDFMFGNKKFSDAILSKLNGTKILVTGNHDPQRVVESPGWAETAQKLTFDHEGYTIHIKHWPWEPKLTEKIRKNVIYLHGHTHNNLPQFTNNQISICVEHWNYTPVSIETIIKTWNEYYESNSALWDLPF